jgi:response regulator of citrate/malate metabolism
VCEKNITLLFFVSLNACTVVIKISFREGANSYILKPMTTEKLLEAVDLLHQYWFGVARLPDKTEP